MTLDAGIRYDHHSVSGGEWIPQGGFTFRLPREAELRAIVSKGFRNPTIRELYMFRPANPDLKSERLMNYELSYRQRFLEDNLTVGANLFYLKADNLISTTTVDGKLLNVNTGETEHWGFELESAYRLNAHLTLNANYSFLHMSNPQISAPEHKAFVGADWTLGRFALNGGLQWVEGLYTAVGENETKENFWLLGLTAKYRLLQGLHLFARGENLLAQRYEYVAGFPMPRATVMAGLNWAF